MREAEWGGKGVGTGVGSPDGILQQDAQPLPTLIFNDVCMSLWVKESAILHILD